MPPKKQKTAHAGDGDAASDLSALDPSVFATDVVANAAAMYAAASPFPHGVVSPLCADASLRAVQAEMREHLTATFKETDLFKVLQTGDLVTIDRANPELVPKIPNLLRLRAAIYSPEFREMVQRMTGCAPLTDRIDCSANVYPRSGHLLCHDDVIGTRCISYIVYLTDPDDGWDEDDGGALALYPVESPGTPAVDPSVSLLPKWNSMAFFTVQPGRSFHAVQEVFADGKPRLSISGWYHAAAPPEGSERATLTQLKTRGAHGAGDDDEIADFVPFPSAIQAVIAAAAQASAEAKGDAAASEDAEDDEALGPDADDLKYLARWVNPEYLDPENVLKIREKMEEDSSVQMREFLLPEIAAALRAATRREDEAEKLGGGRVPNRAAGVGGGWAAVGPTHKQRFLRYEGGGREESLREAVSRESARSVNDGTPRDPKGKAPADAATPLTTPSLDESAGALMRAVSDGLFRSEPFGRLLTALTGLRPTAHKSEARRFRPGLDYTVAHHGVLTTDPRLDATMCFVDDEGEARSAAWDFGEVGGFECYVAADEDGGAATDEVYAAADEEDEDELLSVQATFNTLSLVHRDEGLMRFVKYVSHLAPSSRWDVAAQYTVEAVEDSDDETGGEDDDEESGGEGTV